MRVKTNKFFALVQEHQFAAALVTVVVVLAAWLLLVHGDGVTPGTVPAGTAQIPGTTQPSGPAPATAGVPPAAVTLVGVADNVSGPYFTAKKNYKKTDFGNSTPLTHRPSKVNQSTYFLAYRSKHSFIMCSALGTRHKKFFSCMKQRGANGPTSNATRVFAQDRSLKVAIRQVKNKKYPKTASGSLVPADVRKTPNKLRAYLEQKKACSKDPVKCMLDDNVKVGKPTGLNSKIAPGHWKVKIIKLKDGSTMPVYVQKK